MTRPTWLGRAARNRHCHAIEQASCRWRGGRRDDSAPRREILISTQVGAAGRWYALGTMRTVGDMLEIHAHACPLYLVAVGLASVAWAALTYFDAPPSAFV